MVACCFIVLLSGCQLVTIDDVPEEPRIEQNTVPVEVAPEEARQEEFIELLETVFHLQWPERKNDDARAIYYLALGDSLTRGIGDEYNHFGYTGRLVRALERWPAITEVELDNRGKNGRRSGKVLELLHRGHYDKELARADLITLTVGGNDVMQVVKQDLFALKKEMFDEARAPFAARYQEIVQEIRQRNTDAPIILIGFYNPFSIVTDEFTPFEPIIDEWNVEMQAVAQQADNACFVPIADLFTSNEDLVYHTDFFHPNARGYERMTTKIIETMKQCNIEMMSDGLIGFEEGNL